AGKLLSKIGVGKKDKKDKKGKKDIDDKAIDLTTLRISVPTKTDGNHTLYLRKEKKGYSLIMESTPTFYSDFINQIETTVENKDDKDKALIIAKRLDALIDSADNEKDKQEIAEKLKELSKFTIKIIDLFNLKPLQPENDYKRGKKHGITWQKSDVIQEFKKDLRDKGKSFPLGKWGSKKDLDYAGKLAATLKIADGFKDFPIMPGSTSTVYYVDGSESKPDRIRLRRNKDNKTFHGFPIDSKTAEPIY
ncbi:hypothetical protein, partial [Chryseobacterium hagamense]|uniref:hypothetical protein n=1 Tax=Chryseobacterium hagamense TaxID=395935 RepID=UPI001E2B972E